MDRALDRMHSFASIQYVLQFRSKGICIGTASRSGRLRYRLVANALLSQSGLALQSQYIFQSELKRRS
jgi:hypothetical protein